ncbi:MAG TPA: undecaprenyldiphospho-muramoylpentapeptide beta-N-acetylglucosaminyltransferase [Chloroflexota bacterium]|nr:undecaprenyldiphospho-muramoylpentapeptide beta-N-acetylglucosaminyltransferase [Chloroflexota bacterium]
MRILLAGGGSGGSSAPVLAVAQEMMRRRECQFLYIGTESGPEREMVSALGIPYRAVRTGKLRRYWSVENLTDMVRIPMGLFESMGVVRSFDPDVAFAAGGFAAVPPLLAAALLRRPIVIHQQDVEPGLANRILAPFATAITVTFSHSIAHFPAGKTKVTGNPVRREILQGRREDAMKVFGLQEAVPVVLATGGGTGALGLNRLIAQAAPMLVQRCQLIHITGRGKRIETADLGPRYRQVEFLLEEMPHVLAAADLVVSRSGLSTLTELAALGKPSVLIPMPHSHQIANALVFARGGAAVMLQQEELSGEQLATELLSLLEKPERMAAMSERARAMMSSGAEARIADELERVAVIRRRRP